MAARKKAAKRKATKRKATKRKVTKRKTTKRKTKRKATKRKATKRKKSMNFLRATSRKYLVFILKPSTFTLLFQERIRPGMHRIIDVLMSN